jgi:hypothetical protein
VGPRAGMDDLEKRKFLTLPGLEGRTLGRPVRSQSTIQIPEPAKQCLLTYVTLHVSTLTSHPQVLQVSHIQLLKCIEYINNSILLPRM